MIEAMLARYEITDGDGYEQALKEVMQEIALAGLYRGEFFKTAAFYGGTALRIFHGLDRFSEDLDFSLLRAEHGFRLEPYFSVIESEFRALGIDVSIQAQRKTRQSAIESAFLKSDTHKHVLQLSGHFTREQKTRAPVKIRFEVDTRPPLGFETEERLLLLPFSFYVKCFSISDLYAGKLHALLFRGWRNRVKGRDWYDFEWYVRHQHPLRLSHLAQRAWEGGQLTRNDPLTRERLIELLSDRIAVVDFDQAREDVKPFVLDDTVLNIWSSSYFNDLAKQIQVVPESV